MADYRGEAKSKYEIWQVLGWPYETSVAMARLVFSGILDRLPEMRIITHHLGAMIPYFEGRVGPLWDQLGTRTSDEDYSGILAAMKARGRRPIDYFRLFYNDTAVGGSASAIRCGLDFFGADRVLFATDCPFDPEGGPMFIRETIAALNGLVLADEERARHLLRQRVAHAEDRGQIGGRGRPASITSPRAAITDQAGGHTVIGIAEKVPVTVKSTVSAVSLT